MNSIPNKHTNYHFIFIFIINLNPNLSSIRITSIYLSNGTIENRTNSNHVYSGRKVGNIFSFIKIVAKSEAAATWRAFQLQILSIPPISLSPNLFALSLAIELVFSLFTWGSIPFIVQTLTPTAISVLSRSHLCALSVLYIQISYLCCFREKNDEFGRATPS